MKYLRFLYKKFYTNFENTKYGSRIGIQVSAYCSQDVINYVGKND